MLSRRFIRSLIKSALYDTKFYPSPQCAVLTNLHGAHKTSPPSSPQHRASSSSTRWKTRQGKDHFAKEAKVQGLKSRAAFKLLEMNEKYRLFRPGDTVIDLGYAPGSWSQVAASRTAPNGRVVGIDIIPAQPPRGVSTIQGNFLSPAIQAEVRAYVQDPAMGRPRQQTITSSATADDREEAERGYIDLERRVLGEQGEPGADLRRRDSAQETDAGVVDKKTSVKERDRRAGRVVDVVLSDMSAPWDQTDGFHKNSLSNPYIRMMNTSGVAFRDHAGSMDLCTAALTFAFDTLRTGGHFVCKFYQGAEDKILEKRLRKLFAKVHREKPDSSRSESKEAFFVAQRRKEDALREEVLQDAS